MQADPVMAMVGMVLSVRAVVNARNNARLGQAVPLSQRTTIGEVA